MRVGPQGRYRTYADGTPFFWLGGTHWTFVTEEKWDESNGPRYDSQFRAVVDRRVEQKFNVWQCNFRDGKDFHIFGRYEEYLLETPQGLKALIDEFAAAHLIDRSRIYVGRCSNGGFMSMRLMIDYPGYFAAGYPMCEALYNDTISDEQIAVLAKTPVWLLHAVTDAIVSPEETAVPTYKRLIAAGARNAHRTYIDDRPPMSVINHGVWVPGLRDEFNIDFDGQPVLSDGKEVTRFQWLAKQKLS